MVGDDEAKAIPANALTRRSLLRQCSTLTLSAAGALLQHSPGAASQAAPRVRPNFVFFLVDDLGWMDTGAYGSTFYETPNIDRLAREGMRFRQAYAACPVCSPTRASILTGKYPARLHLTDWIAGHQYPWAKLKVPDFNLQLPLSETTIAEALKPAGYRSASFGKWHLGGQGYHPDSQGFERNYGGDHRGQPPSYFSPFGIPTLPDGAEGDYLTDHLTDEVLRFVDESKSRPFFVYLPFYNVHTPIQGKPDYTKKYERKLKTDDSQFNAEYAAMVQSVDDNVGRVLTKLDDLGLTEDTVVFFMSDNGGLSRVTNNAPLREGKGTPYEGGIREPLIVRWPGRIQAGSFCEEPVTSVDFYPTILQMARVEGGDAPGVDGESLVPLLENTGAIETRSLYWHYPHYHSQGATPFGAVRRGDYKLIEFYEDNRVELYHLAQDLSETNNLAASMPQKVDELRNDLHQWLRAVEAQMPTPNPDYNPDKAGQRVPRNRPPTG